MAMVPVSVHGTDETALVESGTNKVSGMFTQLATDVDDPVERVDRAAELARRSRTITLTSTPTSCGRGLSSRPVRSSSS